MKKIFVISALLMLAFGAYVEARVQYDTSGRTIVTDDTIRGRRRAAEAQAQTSKKIQAAAAAKMDYEAALRSLEPSRHQSNFYQDRIK